MPIPHKAPDGTTDYTEGLGAGTSGDPYRGKSILQNDVLVGSGNPLHVQSADIQARLGDTNEAAAGSDTATSGLNGLFKRLLQRITALIASVDAQARGTEASPVVGRGKMRVFRVNPTLSTSAAPYAANDAMGGLQVLSAVTAGSGRGTFLHSIQVNCVQAPSFVRFIFFDAEPNLSTFTDNGAVVLNYGDQEKMCGYFDIGAGIAVDGNTYTAGLDSTSPALPKAMMPVVGDSLWYVIQARAGVTINAATDLDYTFVFYDE